MQDIGTLRAQMILESQRFKKGMQDARDEMKKTGFSAVQASRDMKRIQMGALAIGAAVAAGIGASVSVAANFEQSMARVKAVSGATEAQFADLEKTARKLGATTQFSASEAAQGMEYLAMAGFETNEIIASMPGVLNLAAAAQIDLGRSSDIVSNIMTGFGLSADETGRAVDVLVQTMRSANTDLPQLGDAMKYVAPVAKSLGLSIEETAAAVGKMSDAGIQGSQAGTSLRAALLALANPIGQTEKAIDRLNIKVTDADGKMKPLPELIGHIGDKLDGMTEAQKTATVAQLVGTEAASGFLALIDQGEDGLNEYTKSLENAAGAAEEVAKTQMDTLIGSFKEFQSALEEVGIAVGDEFLPEFRKLVGLATDVIRAFGELDPAVVSTGLKMAGTAAGVALVISTLGKLALAIRGLYFSMGPAGWLIIGLSTLAGVVVGVNDAMTRNNEINLEATRQLIDQEKALSGNIARYEELALKNQLTNDELGKFLDINSEIAKTASPEKVAELKDEQDKLREKSGLTNEEFAELLSLNDQLIETVPQSTVKITDQGNALLETTDAARQLNSEQREKIRLDLESKLATAEANRTDLLREEKGLIRDIKDLEAQRIEIANEIETKIEEIDAKEELARQHRAQGNEAMAKTLETQITAEKLRLQVMKEERAEILKKLQKKQEDLGLTQEELKKIGEIKQEMINIELAQVGINGKKGDGVAIIDEEINNIKVARDELIKNTSAQDRQRGVIDDQLRGYDEQIGKLEIARGRVAEITGEQGRVNYQIDRGRESAERMNLRLRQPINKNIKYTGDGLRTAEEIHSLLSKPAYKTLNISERVTRQVLRMGGNVDYHQGGSPAIDPRIPKLHDGGSLAMNFSAPPMHNEIDARLLPKEMMLTEAQQAQLFSLLDSTKSLVQSTSDFSTTNALLLGIEQAIRESKGDAVFKINGREFARATVDDMDHELGRKKARR